MSSQLLGSPAPDAHAAERSAQVRDLADRAWTELRRRGVLPTPANIELWDPHFGGGKPALSRRLAALLHAGAAPSPEQLQELHADCVGQEVDVEAIADSSDQIEQAACAVIDQVAGSQASLRGYGEVLSGIAGRLDQDQTLGSLVQAIAVLTAETARASERNRALEQQLSATVGRIAKLRQTLAEAKQNATTDCMTGLCNRKGFDYRLRRAVGRARSDGQALSVALLDIDHFKRFNDTYGHATGDLVLRLVGRVIADNVKGRDTAARYGGEEFVILLNGADLRPAAVVAGQIRTILDGKRLTIKGMQQDAGRVTISAGVAQFRAGDSAVSLVERADAALYEAKRLGRNRVCIERLTPDDTWR